MTDRSDAMFEPFTDDELQAAERVACIDKSGDLQLIVPVPVDVPEPDWSQLRPQGAIGEPVGNLDLPHGRRRSRLLRRPVEAREPHQAQSYSAHHVVPVS